MEKRFIVDGMLGSLARKLRLYGFDTIYDTSIHDHDMIKIAYSQNRVLLTADRELFGRAVKKNIDSILVMGANDAERLACIFTALAIRADKIDPERSRCPACNGTLALTDKPSVSKKLPSRIIERHQEFYACSNCGKLYWKGSHWRRIESLAKEVRERLEQT